jgi:3-dehydroquinate synthase class II
MTSDLTDSRRHTRFSVLSVDKTTGTVRVRSEAQVCTDVGCRDAEVVTEEGTSRDLDRLHAGDIVTLEEQDGRTRQIRVVRRAWEEYSSPQW